MLPKSKDLTFQAFQPNYQEKIAYLHPTASLNEKEKLNLYPSNGGDQASSWTKEQIIDYLTKSQNGAYKYLNEILMKLKKTPRIEIKDVSTKLSFLFEASISVDELSATKVGSSKKEAKNSAALALIPELIARDKYAESILITILFKGKNN